MRSGLLVRKNFHNKRYDRVGVIIVGERGSGKTTQLITEAFYNKGVLITPVYTSTLKEKIKDMGIDENIIPVFNLAQFKNGATKGIDKPIYIDEMQYCYHHVGDSDIFHYMNEGSKICGFTESIADYAMLDLNDIPGETNDKSVIIRR